MVYKSEPKVRRVVANLDGESDGGNDANEEDSISSSKSGKRLNNNNILVHTVQQPKTKTRSKINGLTIDIPKQVDANNVDKTSNVDDDDEFDVHEYVNLVDCQRYREEMSHHSSVVGSNPVLHFPNVIGYASTQHILALYGNPRTPLLPDHYQQHPQQGASAPHHHLHARLSGLLSPTERYTKTLSNGDLRHHYQPNLAAKFGANPHNHSHHAVATNNRRACSTLDISDQRSSRHLRHHTATSYRTSRTAFNFENIKTPLNLSTNDVVY